jgi:hypothetical protein
VGLFKCLRRVWRLLLLFRRSCREHREAAKRETWPRRRVEKERCDAGGKCIDKTKMRGFCDVIGRKGALAASLRERACAARRGGEALNERMRLKTQAGGMRQF